MNQNIIPGNNALKKFAKWLQEQEYSACYILVDHNTRKYCLPALQKNLGNQSCHILEVPPGETQKNLDVCRELWSRLLEKNADRRSVLINLGGGVIGDLGGFVAATFKRGIDFIQIPTTLLAMTDAAIGGKTGVNINHLKNQVGVFRTPAKIVIYPPFLYTLDYRQLLNGFSEMVKHALIGDSELWKKLSVVRNLTPELLSAYLEPSIAVKENIVNRDPEEAGERKKLNFGHTVGHAIESFFIEHRRNSIFHGKAVALGMITEAYLSTQLGLLKERDYGEIKGFINDHYSGNRLNAGQPEEICQYMFSDKKNIRKGINFTLLVKPGKAVIDQYIEVQEISRALQKTLLA